MDATSFIVPSSLQNAAVLTIILAFAGYLVTFMGTRMMARRTDLLRLVNQRINEFYGPLYVATVAGNIAYRSLLKKQGKTQCALFEMVRLDHFRGFEAYWEVPGGEPTAIHGRWVKGRRRLSVGAQGRIWRVADCGRKPGRDYAGGGRAAPQVWIAGDEPFAICLWNRFAGFDCFARTITAAT